MNGADSRMSNLRFAKSALLPRLKHKAGRWFVSLSAFALTACTGGRHLSFPDPQFPIAASQRKHFLEMVGLLGFLSPCQFSSSFPFLPGAIDIAQKLPSIGPTALSRI
jgi:hypothetical protein